MMKWFMQTFNFTGAVHVFVFRETLVSQVSREKQDPKVNL